MKKILLTSDGLSNPALKEALKELIGKPLDSIFVLFVPTATRTQEGQAYVQESRNVLIQMGILGQHIIDVNLEKQYAGEELETFGLLYVCGGNTFYLLHSLRKSGFAKNIVQMVGNGCVYVGVSAGSNIAGVDIDIAAPYDENDCSLTEKRGLGLVPFVTACHFNSKDPLVIRSYEEKTSHRVVRLNDGQAVLVLGEEEKLIG